MSGCAVSPAACAAVKKNSAVSRPSRPTASAAMATTAVEPILIASSSLPRRSAEMVRAALDNPLRDKRSLLVTPNALMRLRETGPVEMRFTETTPKELDRLLGADAVHQGVALQVEAVSRFGLNDVPSPRLVVVLDQLTDPHNVGAILRTACAFGADAVVTTARHSPRETGVMAKAASGALDLVPMIEVRNLGDAIEKLKERGLTVIGFDSEAPAPLRPRTDDVPLAVVLGAEGKGLRQRTRELCDEMVRLDMPGPIKSLNVSNAAAIALFAATAGRRLA